jgi:hypothetical protein
MGRRSSNGEDVFLGLCGLMATGARTVLLSRWRTGGQTCNELVREFVQELPHQSAPAAWQRSVQLLRGTTVVAEAEPRVKVSEAIDVDISADHPFFWAGYLLVDSGSRPLSEKPAGKPAEKPAPAAKAPADDKPKPAAESAEPEKTETKPKVTEDTPEPPKKPTGPAVP